MATISSTLDVVPITPAVGGIVEGVDLTRPLDAETVQRLREAWLDRGVLFFRDQHLSEAQLETFMAYFGKPICEPSNGAMGEDVNRPPVHSGDSGLFKAVADPRVTRVGRILRALSIDELPQLFNVISGRMTLVGPRPALPAEVEEFDGELLRRLDVVPGLTGLWQVEARDNPNFSAYRRLDLFYIDNWSVTLDLVILVLTLHVVVIRAVRSLAGRLQRLAGRDGAIVAAAGTLD